MKKIITILILTLVILLTISCDKSNGSTNKQKDKLSQKKVSLYPVKVTPIIKTKVIDYVPFSGRVEGVTDITMNSEVSGRVIGLTKKLGERVNKGDEIGRIDNLDYKIKVTQAKSDLLAKEAALEATNINLETTKTLQKDGSLSKLDLVNATSAYKKAQAGYEGAQATLEIAKKNYNNARFLAPVSGYITKVYLEIGQTIGNGAPVCSIVEFNEVKIITGFGAKDISKIYKDQIIELSFNNYEFNGKVSGIGFKPGVDETYPVEILVENEAKHILPGMIVEGQIESKIYSDVIAVALNDIQEEYGRYYVYIIKNNKAEKRRIEVLIKVDKQFIVKSGLKIGESLVVSGRENLKDKSSVKIVDDGDKF